MTREEAIAELNEAMDEISLGSYTYDGLKRSIALETGIKALEQEPMLDKIRAEIKEVQTYKMFEGEDTVYVERKDVLAIINKYNAESEE